MTYLHAVHTFEPVMFKTVFRIMPGISKPQLQCIPYMFLACSLTRQGFDAVCKDMLDVCTVGKDFTYKKYLVNLSSFEYEFLYHKF